MPSVLAQGYYNYGYPYGGRYGAPYGTPYNWSRYYGSPYGLPPAPSGQYSALYPNIGDPYAPAPDINGLWFMNGERDKPTQIRQYGPDRAKFINENGSRAWGTIEGDRVWIPSWTWGQGAFQHQGLSGVIEGNRIVWPDGSFWSR